MEIESRRELAQFLQEKMASTYRSLKDERRLDYENNLLKSYVIEVHPTGTGTPLEDARALLDDLADRTGARVTLTRDPSMAVLARKAAIFYVDVLDPRFWTLHTVSKSHDADYYLSDLVRVAKMVDRVWMPTQLLEQLASLGRFEGFGVRFDSTAIYGDAPAPGDSRGRSLTLKLRSYDAGRELAFLRQSDRFADTFALSSVRARYENGQSGGAFVIEDITTNGKVTTRGPSFADHLLVLGHLRRLYEQMLKRFEQEYSVGAEHREGGLRFSGHPLTIRFEKRVDDLARFVAALFSATLPFGLWGSPWFIKEEFARVRAIDLHSGKPLSFDISPTFITVYLPTGTCGNTIARLYTNLQHTFDSGAWLEGGSNVELFERTPAAA